MPRFSLGYTHTPREIVQSAYGHEPHPLSPDPVAYRRLIRDGSIAYEIAKGEANGLEFWTVLFARLVNGRGIPMRDESKSFTSESGVLGWIATIEQAGMVS